MLVVLWGGNYTWVKIAVRDIGPWTFNAVRYAAAAILIGALLTLFSGVGALRPARGERMPLALIGLLQGAVTTCTSALALQWIEASRVVLIFYSMPIWALPLSFVILGERAAVLSILGALLGLAGLALLTNPLAMAWSLDTLPGVLISLVGVVAWALGSVLYRRRAWMSTFWQQTFWQLAATAIAVTPIALVLEAGNPIHWSAPLLWFTAYNVIGPTALGYWCWSRVLSRMRATTAGQILLLSPLFGLWQSHFVLGEPLGPWVLMAATAIVLGAWLALVRGP